MILEKIKGLTLEDYLNNEKMLKKYLQIMEDESIDPEVYIELMALMRTNMFMLKTILVFGDELSKSGILKLQDNGDLIISGEKLRQDETLAVHESLTFVKDAENYIEEISAHELELLSIMFLDGISKGLSENEDLNDCDVKEVQ